MGNLNDVNEVETFDFTEGAKKIQNKIVYVLYQNFIALSSSNY